GAAGVKDTKTSVTQVYSIGNVGGPAATIGGFIGGDYYRHKRNYISFADWDLDTSGISDPSQGAGNIPNDPGITGLTDAQLTSALPDGFDPNVWGENANINNG